jgi:hypothetical protein
MLLDSFGSRCGPKASFIEHGNELPGSLTRATKAQILHQR